MYNFHKDKTQYTELKTKTFTPVRKISILVGNFIWEGYTWIL